MIDLLYNHSSNVYSANGEDGINEYILNTEESDYKNLITRLKEISATITSLKKQYLDKKGDRYQYD